MRISLPIPAPSLRRLTLVALLTAAPLLTLQVQGQASSGPTTPVNDASALKPPPGARVAIIEFADMECPVCGSTNPLVRQAADQYHIPWIRYDFPLPYHSWSFEAAVYARWFDGKSKKLGDAFRDDVFANQDAIDEAAQTSPESPSGPTPAAQAAIRAFAQKFAQEHNIAFPFVVDPQKKLAAEVQADLDLGKRIGVNHTPTIWIVSRAKSGPSYVEVVDRGQLYSIIDQALASTRGE